MVEKTSTSRVHNVTGSLGSGGASCEDPKGASGTIGAAQQAGWLSDKSEPRPDLRYQPRKTLEERMSQIVSKGYAVKARAEG